MRKLFNVICILVLTVILSFNGYSQLSEESIRNFNKAEKFLQSRDYESALPLYHLVLEENPDNVKINYKVGLCLIKLLGREREALPYLEKAIENIEEDYKHGETKNSAAPPHAWFILGDAYHRDEMLSEASKAYNNYKQYILLMIRRN